MKLSILHRLRKALCILACSGLLLLCLGCTTTGAKSNEDAGIPAIKTDAIPAESYISSQDEPGDESNNNSVPSKDNLVVRFIDVGQGDAALLTCGDQSLLIDGGSPDASSKIYTILKNLGIRHLDYVIATHPDADHCGGIAGALNYADCGTFFSPVTQHDTKTFNNILKYLGDTPVTVPTTGDSFQLGEATVEFLGPVSHTRDTNNDSLICKVSLGNKSFLFTGDAEFESEMLLINSGANLDVDVLKVGHHGSDSSTSDPFLEQTSPDYAIISVGDNNYGHPTNNVLERLQGCGALVLRTDELGNIIFETNGTDLSVSFSKNSIEQ